ncbi:hypothetical protein MON38_06480 [Hymenobacter sp. DH14]|uniref:Uncharacterized protein n=1 Tax=Hymenobacter cyanobacteriorum TaxID=2926463 RepID=A0A9X2AHX2_9BACT|nr:hypothetical protein [Hymenobacter cyanobacteriorum]MCI1187059.1 hypothetical protein [Hymenobacter cyanobacteriorum]
MISRSWPALLPTALLVLACSRQPTASPAARFAASPPTIDGQASDWADSLRYDPASKLQYQVLNDGRMIYVRLKATDAATQGRIVRLGLTVWLDTTGRNQHQFGVRYPLGGRSQPELGPPQPDNPDASAADRQATRRARIALALAGLREMELLNYKGSKEPTLTDAQSQLGVKAALAADAQEDLVYELAVPLRLLYKRLPALNPGKVAVVGVTIVGNTPGNSSVASPDGSVVGNQNNVGMRGGYGGYGGGYGGGMRGGGMRGGRGGYGGGYGGESLSLKTSVQLSTK